MFYQFPFKRYETDTIWIRKYEHFWMLSEFQLNVYEMGTIYIQKYENIFVL